MAKYRETPCKYYVAFYDCAKGREACQSGYCQYCNKYYPRAKVRHCKDSIFTRKFTAQSC